MALLSPGLSSVAHAQEVAARVGVLRETSESVSAQLRDEVDAALLRDLSAIAGIRKPLVSPVELAEIELSVGCPDDSHACLAAIARTLGVDALVVRSLRADAPQSQKLELRYFDLASSEVLSEVATEAVGEQSLDQGRAELVAAVPGLVRKLFRIPEVVAPAVRTDAPSDANVGDGVAWPAWLALGAGVAALTAGIVVGVDAERDFDTWKDKPLRSPDDARAANAAFDDLEDRALAANILVPVGAALLGLGATLLVLDLANESDPHKSAIELGVVPRREGALLFVRRSFQTAF